MPLRRAGTVPDAGVRYDPGSAAHRKSAALRPGNGLIPGHLQVSDAAVAAAEADRAFPIGEAGRHPDIRVQWRSFDPQTALSNRNAPLRRQLAAVALARCGRRHDDVGGAKLCGFSIPLDPVAGEIVLDRKSTRLNSSHANI